MNANELRIGNLLYYKNTQDVASVELIHKKHFDCRDEYGSFTPNGNYEPIPLTEEWLLRCGYIKGLDEESIIEGRYYKGEFMIEKGISEYFDNSYSFRKEIDKENSLHLKSLKYLHELQNIENELTGT